MCEKQPILSVNHITKTFTTAGWQKNHNSVKAVNDVSFCVDAGKTLGIVGESGCGKTTLAKIILRLETVDSGSVMFNGHNVLRADKKQLRQIREQPYFAAIVQIADFLLSCPAALLDDQRSAIKQQQQDSGA